mmetsp:Transcript_66288/g.158580  ORF Transcript_66288/g.158580 Transcript_66288/m.158580 type:complete len:605 (+) Transcript_66288:79-1893(+)
MISQRGLVSTRKTFQLELLLTTFLSFLQLVACIRDDGPQVYHPGHKPATVIRLHRYDHSGLESFLEAERQWHATRLDAESRWKSNSRARAALSPELLLTNRAVTKTKFLQLSERQAQGLVDSHRAWSSSRRHNFNDGENKSEEVMYNAAGHRLSRPEMLANGMAVTGLTSLSSQYVGPIGVGSQLSPPECKSQAAALLQGADRGELVYLPESAKQDPSFIQEVRSCHTEDQSQIWVVFDTGSTNIWVASDLCQAGSCAKKGRRRYNHTASFSYSPPKQGIQLTVEFGTGKIRGPQAVDEFHIGPFTIANQTFGMIEAEEGSVFDDVPFEGILGLAFPSMSAHGVRPFFDNIVHQKVLKNNEFAFYFSLDSPTANAILWGGVDSAFYTGSIEYFPVVEPFYWSVELISFRIGDEELIGETGGNEGAEATYGKYQPPEKSSGEKWKRSPKAILDTGTTFYTAEDKLFNVIMDKLPTAACSSITESTHPPITYKLRNARGDPREFVIDHSKYMTISGKDQCSPAFMRINIPSAHGPAMVLGECFFRHWFAVFDRGDGSNGGAKVGLAQSKHNEAQSRLMTLTGAQPTFTAASVLEQRNRKRPRHGTL